MSEPKEPPCPLDRIPHAKRVEEINHLLAEDKIGGICIDNTQEHIAWYLHELKKYPRLVVVYQGVLNEHTYLIKVRKGPSNN